MQRACSTEEQQIFFEQKQIILVSITNFCDSDIGKVGWQSCTLGTQVT